MLGEGTYRCAILSRGGGSVLAEIDSDIITELSWGRKLEDAAEAKLSFSISTDPNCLGCKILQIIDPLATELLILRDNIPVWVGPITVWEASRDRVDVEALDLSIWLDWRVLHADHRFRNTTTNLVRYAMDLAEDALSPDNPNITVSGRTGSLEGSRDVRDNDFLVAQDEIAEVLRTGVEMIVRGRDLHFFEGDDNDMIQLPELTDEDFLEDVVVRRDGLKTATRVIVNGNNSLWGVYPREPYEGDPRYGLKERIFNDTSIMDQASLDQAAKSRYDFLKAPVTTIEIPNSARISPLANISIHDMMPGRHQKITLRYFCVPISSVFRLTEVSVSVSEGKESVSCSWSPLGTVVE